MRLRVPLIALTTLALLTPGLTAQAAPAATATPPAAAVALSSSTIGDKLTTQSTSRYLGPHLSGIAVDQDSGEVLWSTRTAQTRMPASTQKILTAFTVLRSVDPNTQLVTRTAQSRAHPDNVYLVGAGDPSLVSAKLRTLAQRTAADLAAQGRTTIDLYVDDSLFPAPTSAVGWKPSYLVGEVQRVRGLTLAGYRGADGALAAGRVFRAHLAASGITVADFGRGVAPARQRTISSSWSRPVSSLLSTMLSVSSNDYAEYLLRIAAHRNGLRPTWTDSLAHQRRVLTRARIPLGGYVAHDGSGLSRANRMPARTLVATVRELYDHPRDRAIAFAYGAMPRSGQTGTLRTRFAVPSQRCARGKVLAKTGTLNDVVALAGVARGVDGRTRTFAFLENGRTETAAARLAVDALATTLVGC